MKHFYPHSPMEKLYASENLAQKVRMSLNLMLYCNIFGNMHGIICGGGTTAMIGLANVLGAGDLAFGVLNGIPQAAALLQIPFSMLVNRTHHRKKYLLTFGLFSRGLWMLFGFIPLLMPMAPQAVQLWTLIFLLGISSCCSASINVCWFPWFSDLAPIRIRARWFSIRDTEVAAVNLVFGLLVAWLLQTLDISVRYPIIFVIGGLAGMMDMILFAFCEEKYSTQPQRITLGKMFSNVWHNKPFVRFTLMWTAWNFTANLAGAYMNRYSMNEMGLDFMQIMIFVTMAASLGTMLSMRQWGKLMGTIGCRNVMMIGCLGAAIAQGAYLFSSPGNVVPSLLNNLVGALFWSGSNLAANSMQLSNSPEEGKPSYIAVFSCVTSLAGTALGTLLGGTLLEVFHSSGWFSGGFDRYKALVAMALALRVAMILILVPRLTNDVDFDLKDWMRKQRFRGFRRSGRI